MDIPEYNHTIDIQPQLLRIILNVSISLYMGKTLSGLFPQKQQSLFIIRLILFDKPEIWMLWDLRHSYILIKRL